MLCTLWTCWGDVNDMLIPFRLAKLQEARCRASAIDGTCVLDKSATIACPWIAGRISRLNLLSVVFLNCISAYIQTVSSTGHCNSPHIGNCSRNGSVAIQYTRSQCKKVYDGLLLVNIWMCELTKPSVRGEKAKIDPKQINIRSVIAIHKQYK